MREMHWSEVLNRFLKIERGSECLVENKRAIVPRKKSQMWTLVSVGTRRGGFIGLFVWIRCSICVTARRCINLGCVCRCVFMWVCQTVLALLMVGKTD